MMNKALKTLPLLAILLLSACKNDAVIDGIPVEDDEKIVICKIKARKGMQDWKECDELEKPYLAIFEKQKKIHTCAFYPSWNEDEKAECKAILANNPRMRQKERNNFRGCISDELFLNLKTPGCDEIKKIFRTP